MFARATFLPVCLETNRSMQGNHLSYWLPPSLTFKLREEGKPGTHAAITAFQYRPPVKYTQKVKTQTNPLGLSVSILAFSPNELKSLNQIAVLSHQNLRYMKYFKVILPTEGPCFSI